MSFRKTSGAGPGTTARSAALNHLSRRRLTGFELKSKLEKNGYEAGEIDDAVKYLADIGYINDEQISIDAARTMATLKTLGPIRIAAKLKIRGIEKKLVAEAIEKAFDATDPKSAAEKSLRKKFGKSISWSAASREEIQKAARHLARAGFGWDTIRSVLGKTETDGSDDSKENEMNYFKSDGAVQ